MAPIIKAASPTTLVGAGDFYGARPNGQGNSNEAAYYAAFVVDPNLDFTTMDVYADDPASIAEFVQWAQMAHANNKIVYMEETARPQFLPSRCRRTGKANRMKRCPFTGPVTTRSLRWTPSG